MQSEGAQRSSEGRSPEKRIRIRRMTLLGHHGVKPRDDPISYEQLSLIIIFLPYIIYIIFHIHIQYKYIYIPYMQYSYNIMQYVYIYMQWTATGTLNKSEINEMNKINLCEYH